MTERRLNMIIEKEYFDSEEVRKANAMNDKTMAPPRRIRLATTDSNKYYAKAVFVADKENIITDQIFRSQKREWHSVRLLLSRQQMWKNISRIL
jgi:hypothetical protein